MPENARLSLATRDELDSLSSGVALGTAGYPVQEMLLEPAQALATVPQLHVGVVTSVTDMFGLPADFAQRQLIQHDLPLTGGQSGSPIVGASGNVVAVINAMNAFSVQNIGRIPNAALINFGQRADLVQELLDGTAETKLIAARSYWQAIGKHFAEAKDVFQQQNLAAAKPGPGMTAKLLETLPMELVAKSGWRENRRDEDRYVNSFELVQKLMPGNDYYFAVAGEGGTTQLTAIVDNDEGKPINVITAYHPFIACRLLTPAQQLADPKNPRPACVSGKDREAVMQLPTGPVLPRNVQLIVFNIRSVNEALAGVPLKYTLRAYQWVPDIPRFPNPFLK